MLIFTNLLLLAHMVHVWYNDKNTHDNQSRQINGIQAALKNDSFQIDNLIRLREEDSIRIEDRKILKRLNEKMKYEHATE